jgi:hypothetical protein
MKNLKAGQVITSKKIKGHYKIKGVAKWGYVTMRGGIFQDILFEDVDKVIK